MLCWLCLLVMFALYSKVWVSFPKHLSRSHDECSWIKGFYKSRGLGPEGVGNPLKAEHSAFMGRSAMWCYKASSLNHWVVLMCLGGNVTVPMEVSCAVMSLWRMDSSQCLGWTRAPLGIAVEEHCIQLPNVYAYIDIDIQIKKARAHCKKE